MKPRGDDGFICGLRKKAVHEIDVAAAGNAAIQRTLRLCHVELVPPDLRNLETVPVREAHDFTGKDAQTGRATVELFAPLEQSLIADADPEKRPAALDERARSFEQLLFPQSVDAIVEGAHAGQHHAARVFHGLGVLDNANVPTHLEQRLVDAAQVAGTVVKQCDHGASALRSGKTLLSGASPCPGDPSFSSRAALELQGLADQQDVELVLVAASSQLAFANAV